MQRISLEGISSAGAVLLADDGLRRKRVGLFSSGDGSASGSLLSPLHYLRQALSPTTDLVEAGISDILQASPDVLILADIGRLSDGETLRLSEWVESGGQLLQFAGPRFAANQADPREA